MFEGGGDNGGGAGGAPEVIIVKDHRNHNEPGPQKSQVKDNNNEFDWFNGDYEEEDVDDLDEVSCFSKWPLFIKTILMAIFGSAVLIAPGLISLFFFTESCGDETSEVCPGTPLHRLILNRKATGMALGQLPFFYYSVYACISWSLYCATRYAVTVIPEILVRISNLIFRITNRGKTAIAAAHYIDYLRHLKTYIGYFVWALVNRVVWAVWRSFFGNPGNDIHLTIDRVFTSLAFAAGVWLGQKFLLQAFSVYFHKRAYEPRIKKDKHATEVLEALSKARDENSIPIGLFTPKVDPNGAAFKVGKVGEKLARKVVKVGADVGTGFIDVTKATFGVSLKSKSGIRKLGNPFTLAKETFEALNKNTDDTITIEEFNPFFVSQNETEAAFKVFDRDGNGDISKDEFLVTVLDIYSEHSAIDRSMRQSNQAIGKLDSLMKVFVYIIVTFIVLAIFEFDTSNFLAVTISLWAGTLFAIGGTIRSFVESIIFLFVMHPYDVNDKVEINGVTYIVKEFALTGTVFTTIDGRESYGSNWKLFRSFINNISRSGPQSESMEFVIEKDTTSDQLDMLKDILLKYIESSESRELFPRCSVGVNEVKESGMVITIGIDHKSNFKNGGAKASRKSRVMLKIREGMMACGIELKTLAA